MADQIIIELIADVSGLAPAEQRLADLGKIDAQSAVIFKKTNDEIKARSQAFQQLAGDTSKLSISTTKAQDTYNKLVASLKNLSGQSKDAVQQLLKMSAIDVSKGFEQAAISVDDYITALSGAGATNQNTTTKTAALRTELLNLNNQLAELKLSGQQNSLQFAQLAEKAGELREALQENRTVISNLSKGTPILTALGAGLQGLAGGFSAAEGAAALFGGDQKDLQEVLVKVNAAMAISQGIQSSLNAIRESAAVSTIQLVIAEKINNAQIAIENGLQSESAIARAAATVAQYALNVAMSLNPIGIVVVALVAFISAIYIYTSASKKAAEATAELNAAVQSGSDLFDAYAEGSKRANDKIVSDLEKAGAKRSDIEKQNLQNTLQIQRARVDEINRLNDVITKNQDATDKDQVAALQDAEKLKAKLEQDNQKDITDIYVQANAIRKELTAEQLQDIANVLQGRLALVKKNSDAEFDLERQLLKAKSAIDINAAGQDKDKVFEIQSQLRKDLRELNLKEDQRDQQSKISGLEATLSAQQVASEKINSRISQDEIDTQKKLIREKANLSLLQEGLTANQILAIKQKALQDQFELQKQFDLKSNAEVLQDEISRTNAELTNVNLTNKERLGLVLDNIITQAQIEVDANHGLSDKIKEINAKRDADIAAARIASIKKELADEIALNDVNNADFIRQAERNLEVQAQIAAAGTQAQKRQIEEITGIQRESLQEQIALIDDLTETALEDSFKREQALRKEFETGGLALIDFNEQYKQAQDDQVKIKEDAEKRKQALIKKTADDEKQKIAEIIQIGLEQAQAVFNIFDGISQNNLDASQIRIDAEKKHIQDLSDAGAITAKEASSRNKKLDLEQRQLQLAQAKRDKEVAIFNAVIATAEAVVKAFTVGPIAGLAFAAVVAAIGAAEIAVIASRPLPKLKTGKSKDNRYEGPAVVGEAGAELIERNGQMYITKEPTITWIGKQDVVYTPAETIAMMSKPSINNMVGETITNNSVANFKMDYDRLGKSLARNIPQHGLNIDDKGFTKWMMDGISKKTWLDKRRDY